MLLDLGLEEWLYKWPEDYLVDYAVYGARFLLVLEEAHLASVHSQTQICGIDYSDPTEIIRV